MNGSNPRTWPGDGLEAVLRPTSQANGLPNEAYVSAQFADYEREHLLGRTWACIGFASDVPEPGDAKPVDWQGLPLLMLRDSADTLRVFHNVCSHRGQLLVSKPCRVKGGVRCPYHSWTYGLDGALRGTPHVGGPGVHESPEFDRGAHGLKPVRMAEWLDLVFVNLSGEAPGLERYLAPVLERWQPLWGEGGVAELRTAADHGRIELEVRANWKLAVENYCESYHLPWVHPGLNTYSRLEDHYNIVGEAPYAGQGSHAYRYAEHAGIALPRFAQWPQDRVETAEYIALFPNVLLGLQVDHAYAIVLHPVGHDRTLERVQLYYVGDDAVGPGYETSRRKLVEGWREVFVEDVWAVEGLQRGRHSPAFTGGVFSPAMDTPTHRFHRWVAEALRG